MHSISRSTSLQYTQSKLKLLIPLDSPSFLPSLPLSLSLSLASASPVVDLSEARSVKCEMKHSSPPYR